MSGNHFPLVFRFTNGNSDGATTDAIQNLATETGGVDTAHRLAGFPRLVGSSGGRP